MTEDMKHNIRVFQTKQAMIGADDRKPQPGIHNMMVIINYFVYNTHE